jgi:hypothetical protein
LAGWDANREFRLVGFRVEFWYYYCRDAARDVDV